MIGGGECEVLQTAGFSHFKQVASESLVLLLRRKRINAVMSLVWLTLSTTLEKSITMVNVRCGGNGRLKRQAFLCAEKDGSGGVVETKTMLGG